jgi:hypothetical protein
MKPLLLFSAILLLCASVQADPEMRSKYGPDPGSGFPQIIQADDYATIEFIEALCRSLAQLPRGKEKPDQFGQPVGVTVAAAALTFHSLRDPTSAVRVVRHDAETIQIQEAPFKDKPTVILFTTLLRILTDFSKEGACRGARFVQFGTKSYKTRSVVEFDFGPRVVVVDSLSNGPKDDERLYILDVIPRKESMFWSREPR